MKIKELEQKVLENQKIKESLDNEKELWKNKANNLKRNSATKKPELLSNFKNYPSPDKKSHLIQVENNFAIPIVCSKNTNLNSKEITINNRENFENNNKTNFLNNRVVSPRYQSNSYSNNIPNQNIDSGNKSINRSGISGDILSDNEIEESNLNPKKLFNKKVIVNEINSDVEDYNAKYIY